MIYLLALTLVQCCHVHCTIKNYDYIMAPQSMHVSVNVLPEDVVTGGLLPLCFWRLHGVVRSSRLLTGGCLNYTSYFLGVEIVVHSRTELWVPG